MRTPVGLFIVSATCTVVGSACSLIEIPGPPVIDRGAAFGVIVEPRHGSVLPEPTAEIAIPVRGYHNLAGYTVELQVLDNPADPDSWVTLAAAETSNVETDGMYEWTATLRPTELGRTDRWAEGALLRIRAVGQAGDQLQGMVHDADTCLAANQTMSRVERLRLCAGGVEVGPILVSPLAPPNLGENRPLFLVEKGVGSPLETDEYYAAINAPLTFADFRTLYGFTGADVAATFYNRGDLAAGREIRCRTAEQPVGTIACYSSNYGEFSGDPGVALEAAIAGTESGVSSGAFATVAMVYTPPITAPNSVQFVVYGPDGALLNEAALDTYGDNPTIPHNCLNCHGSGSTYDADANAVLNARFLPFDPEQFTFSEQPGYSRPDQEENIRVLNALVLGAELPTAATDYITGMYAGNIDTPGAIADGAFVPTGWQESALSAAVYRNAVAPFCRGCHASRDGDDPLDFSSAERLRASAGAIGRTVCGAAGPDGAHSMPNAEAVLREFWSSPARAYLAGFLDINGPCQTATAP